MLLFLILKNYVKQINRNNNDNKQQYQLLASYFYQTILNVKRHNIILLDKGPKIN